MSWQSVVDRLALPVTMIVAGVVLLLNGERELGYMLLAGGAGVAAPQRASGLIPKRS